jgi:formate dehydrogenase maturation protein FdhE
MPPEQNDEYTWETESQIDPVFQAKEEAWAHQKRLERVQQIAQDDMRARLLNLAPDIAHEAEQIENALRELVDFERSKLPSKHNFGYLILKVNKAKARPKDPDVIGNARIGNKNFKALGYSNTDPIGEKFLKITLEPRD